MQENEQEGILTTGKLIEDFQKIGESLPLIAFDHYGQQYRFDIIGMMQATPAHKPHAAFLRFVPVNGGTDQMNQYERAVSEAFGGLDIQASRRVLMNLQGMGYTIMSEIDRQQINTRLGQQEILIAQNDTLREHITTIEEKYGVGNDEAWQDFDESDK